MADPRVTHPVNIEDRKILEVEGYGRYMDYAVFQEGDLSYEAWEPANDNAKRFFVIRIYRGDEKIHEEYLAMLYPNIFGVDITDAASLNRRADLLVEQWADQSG